MHRFLTFGQNYASSVAVSLRRCGFIVAGGACLAGGAAGLAADWSQYRGPDVGGISPETIPGDRSKPKCLWRIPINGGFSTFVVGEGKALTVVARDVDGKLAEVCVALDAATGKEL
jgi:hypothetical protein